MMNRKLKKLMSLWLIGGAAIIALAVFSAAPAVAETATQVVSVSIDAQTGGDYRLAGYGECFSVVAQASPKYAYPEVEVGPDFYSVDSDPYDNRCTPAMGARWGCTALLIGELIPDREGGIDSAVCITEVGVPTTAPSTFGFRFYRNPGESHAFAWTFKPNTGTTTYPWSWYELMHWNEDTHQSAPSQWNACLETFRGSTFDNDKDAWDPLSGVVSLGEDNGGDAVIAYYFLIAGNRNSCLKQDWTLYIDEGTGEEILATSADSGGPGPVTEFGQGKYLVFELEDIPDGSTLRLAVKELEIECSNPNSVIGAIYVSGTDFCAQPGTGTPGYWKNHPE